MTKGCRVKLAVQLFALLTGFGCGVVLAAEKSVPPIGLIIDDLGNQYEAGLEAVSLPGPLAYSILPHTPYGKRLAEKAHSSGKEVMLHLPMQSVEEKALGKGGLDIDMSRVEMRRVIRENLDAVPHVIGINNHMGSLLTQHPGQMAWLMEELRLMGGLFFIDSRTTDRTVAAKVARQYNIAAQQRDVFLDHEPNRESILFQFQRLLTLATRKGQGIGIGHPYPETLGVLKKQLNGSGAGRFRLKPISQMIR